MRKKYETRQDLQNEREVCRELAQILDCSFTKMAIKYHIDYAMVDNYGKIIGWCEVKRRKNDHDKYDTFMISLDKWNNGLRLEEVTGLPFIIVVKYDDKTRLIPCQNIKESISYGFGGRYDRGDSQDQEPCVFIPINLMVDI